MQNFAGKRFYSSIFSANCEASVNEWIIDSGATDHMCGNDTLLHDFQTLNKSVMVGLPDGNLKQ